MRIEIQENHKYFQEGQTYDLADLTVLTGKNGSGKTNFLRLLAYDKVKVSIDGRDKSEYNIKLFRYDHFTGTPSKTREAIKEYGDTSINRAWRSYVKYMSDEIKDPKLINNFINIADYHKKDIADLTERDFKLFPLNRQNENLQLFTYQFFEDSALYLKHLDRYKYNHFLNTEYGEQNLVLSREEFNEFYGLPPWETLNDALATVGFKYRFTQPINLDGRGAIEFRLYDIINDFEVPIEQMSDGEKTILKIVCSIYDLKIANDTPDIFLFDEVDALLHPSYSKQVMFVLNEYLVKALNKRVVLVTHSPSTVAISPTDSLFLCQRETFKIEKVSKDLAISELTENINSLSILYENRRQVFVEDTDDAYLYEFIFKHLKKYLHQEISLSFIPISEAKSDDSGGSSKVKNIVKTLRKYGNKQVFGIIDYDLINQSGNFIFVIGRRYSIENYILDPVLLLAYFIREKIIDKTTIGLDDNFRYFDIERLDSNELQLLINDFLKTIGFGVFVGKGAEIVYLNDLKINISEDFFKEQGHVLEERLTNKYKPLKGRIRHHKSIKHAIINDIIGDLPGFISIDFVSLFKKIQKK